MYNLGKSLLWVLDAPTQINGEALRDTLNLSQGF